MLQRIGVKGACPLALQNLNASDWPVCGSCGATSPCVVVESGALFFAKKEPPGCPDGLDSLEVLRDKIGGKAFGMAVPDAPKQGHNLRQPPAKSRDKCTSSARAVHAKKKRRRSDLRTNGGFLMPYKDPEKQREAQRRWEK